MTTNNYNGSIIISGGFILDSNPTINYNAGALNSAPSVDTRGPGRGSTGPHEAHSPAPHVSPPTANTLPPARPQRSFPRSLSLDNNSYLDQGAPYFPSALQRSSTLPLAPPDSLLGGHGLSPGYYLESSDVVYGFRVPIRRDSAVPFQPIGTPLQRQPTYGPMPTAPTLEPHSISSPVVWEEHHPIEEYGMMPIPRSESTASSSTSWPVDDNDTDTADNMDQSHHPEQVYY